MLLHKLYSLSSSVQLFLSFIMMKKVMEKRKCRVGEECGMVEVNLPSIVHTERSEGGNMQLRFVRLFISLITQ